MAAASNDNQFQFAEELLRLARNARLSGLDPSSVAGGLMGFAIGMLEENYGAIAAVEVCTKLGNDLIDRYHKGAH